MKLNSLGLPEGVKSKPRLPIILLPQILYEQLSIECLLNNFTFHFIKFIFSNYSVFKHITCLF